MNTNKKTDTIVETIEQSIEDALDNIPAWVEANIRKLTLVSLGFSDSWGKLEVDHCNGRNSVISDTINSACKKFIEKEVVKYLGKMTLTNTHKEIIKREFESTINNNIGYIARERAKKVCEEAVKKVIDEELTTLIAKTVKDSFASSAELDISNPKFGEKISEKIQLKIIGLGINE